MKKHVLVIVLIGLMTFSFNTLMAQNRPDRKPKMEMVDTLTPSQILKVNGILEFYNSSEVSKEDAAAIMKSLKAEKIPPGKGVEKAFENQGFDFKEIQKLAPRPQRSEGGRPEGGRPRR